MIGAIWNNPIYLRYLFLYSFSLRKSSEKSGMTKFGGLVTKTKIFWDSNHTDNVSMSGFKSPLEISADIKNAQRLDLQTCL